MKNSCALVIILFFTSFFCSSQTIYESINSRALQAERELKIQLPRNYTGNEDKEYPIILVLDGDYLFEPVAGNVDYFSYWEEMPEAIVVGVNHNGNREKDSTFGYNNFLPADEGAAFFEFIAVELMPYLAENYRTVDFSIIVGHDITSNFINYFLLKEKPIFKGYINLSPDYANQMSDRLFDRLSTINEKIWFYQATGSNDIKQIRESVISLDNRLKDIENKNIYYSFDDFPDQSHYSLVGNALPKAFEDFFSFFRPISKKEYDEVILPLETSPYDYLVEKYSTIKNFFGLDKTIRINDFIAVATALEKRKNWEELEKLGKLARKSYPNTMLGNYYLGRAYEELGDPKKAMKTYQNAFVLDEVAFLTKDLMLEKTDKIKTDFGY